MLCHVSILRAGETGDNAEVDRVWLRMSRRLLLSCREAEQSAMRFDLTDLRLFLHVVESESITRGAERAGMALGSASERVRGMELDGGVALLERRPRGVRLTPAGRAVAHHARVVLGQLEQMRGELGQYANGLRGT